MPYKNRSGIIPLIILIIAGIALATTGGAYVVRNEFIKKGQSGKAALNEEKIQNQIENGNPLPSPPPQPDTKLAPTVYTYQPKKDQVSQPSTLDTGSSQEPGFTINPPAGWSQGNSPSSNVIFLSPDKDEEEAEDSLVYSQPANIQIGIDYLENYDNLAAQGLSEKHLLKAVADEARSKTKTLKIIQYKLTSFAGQNAYLIEGTITNRYYAIEHILSYILIKNKHSVWVSGVAVDSAWSKRAGTINASLNTFALTD